MNFISLGSTTKIKTGKLDANANNPNGLYPFFTCSKDTLRIDSYSYDCECVLVAGNGDLNVKHYKGKFDAYQRTYIIESLDTTKLNVRYLYYFLEFYVARLRELAIGGVIKYIKLGHLTEAKIPLRSLYEQKRIVSILDLATSLVKKRKAQIEALDQLTQSVFLEMFGDVRINAKNFPEAKLKEVISKISTGKSLAGNESSQYKVLKTSAVSFKFFKPNEVKNLPRDYVPPKNHLVNKADVLVSRMNTSELVGAAGYVFDEIENVALPDRIWKLHYNEKINPIYLWYYINQPSFRNKVSDIATGTSGSMKNIAQKKYLDIDIVLPPIEIQKQFGEILIKFENMKRQMNKSLIEIEKTFNSIIQRAFKGKLFTEEKLPTA